MKGKRMLEFALFVLIVGAVATAALAATSQGTDVKVSEDALSEVTIDVNPTNGQNLVVVGHDDITASFENMNTFFTTDGGGTWTAAPLGDAGDGIVSNFRFDPAVIFDPSGNAYAAYGARNGTPAGTTVVVARSTDGGATWGTFGQLATNVNITGGPPGNDRWTFASGPGPGGTGQRVYLAWTQNVIESGSTDQRIVVSSTSNAGVTWSAPVIVNDASIAGTDANNLTALPAVGPDGDLYLAWHDITGNQIVFDRSTDGGVTWGTDSVITATGVGFLVSIPPQDNRGVGPIGALQADRSGGTHDDRVYLTYLDTGTGGVPNTDVFTRYSDNDGATWSAPELVNDDGGTTSQFLPWLTVDQETGLVAAVWYDARLDASNRAVNVYSSVSHDGGDTWDANVRVSDTASDMSANNPGSYGGDYLEYIGVTALDCRLVAVWADNSETADTNAATADDFDYFVDRLNVTGGLCNTAPTVSAGGPYTTTEGANVTVAATGNDTDGDTLTYAWDLDNNGSFETAGQSVAFDAVGQDGTFTIRVQVSDGKGGTATATTTVAVSNVPPSVGSLASDGSKPENTAVTVTGVVSDLGWLEALTATVDWGDGSGPQALPGTLENVRPDATLTFSVAHTYGDDGVFTVEVCGKDDDAPPQCASIGVTITNVAPTAEITAPGSTTTINGVDVVVTNQGATVGFAGRSTDPGSDDLALSWNWDDGPPVWDVTTTYLNDLGFTPDPDPSPSVNPRDVTDSKSHAFSACLYDVVFGAADDDLGVASDTVKVLVTGNATVRFSAGYWQNVFRSRKSTPFTDAQITCYLKIAGFVSLVFNETTDASTIAKAYAVLKVGSTATEKEQFDRQLLAALINFANGEPDWNELIDTNGDTVGDAPFLSVIATAEAVRNNPASTKAQIVALKNLLEKINLGTA